ncbi:MAG TPA: ABC transporter permease [Paenibacillaceae bacterium]|nr:ABC transporter permease [Paenibacillaceae bacterium]
MNHILRLTFMESKLFFREKQAVFWTFLFPILLIWLFGAMFGDQKIGQMSYSNAYIPSWIAINMLTTALFTIGTVLTEYREQGILRRYQATPIRPGKVLTAHIIYGTLIFLLSALLIVLFGSLAYNLDFPKYLGSTLIAIALSIFAIFPFGIFATSLAKNSRTSAAISSVILNLMLFLSGATFPLEMMPEFLQGVAKILPLYYVVDLLRQTWNFAPITDQLTNVWILLGIGVVSTILATRFFNWGSRG